jgi:hypothetical protein
MIARARGQLLVAGALTGAFIGPPAAVAAQDAPPAVRIDVAVTSRSAAVPVLDAKAFTISVNGTPREVIAAEPAVAPGSGRTIYVAIDETSVFRGAEASLRTAASAIADRLAPGDRLGVVLLPQGRPALPPTDDAAAIEKALAGITGRRPNDFANFSMGVGEALGISESDTLALTGVADRDCRMPDTLRPAAGSPVVPATRTVTNQRRTCVQAIVRNVEVMMQRVHASGLEAYRGLVDFVASLREAPGPKAVVLLSAGFAIALDAGVFDELAIRAALSDVAVDAVLVEPAASPNTRRLMPANIINDRRSLMRRLNELAGSALGTAHSAVGGSQDAFDRLMTATTRYRLDVRPGPDGTRDVAAKVAAAVTGAGLSVTVRPYFVPPAPRTSTAATTPDGRLDRALAGTPPEGERLPLDAAGYLAGLPGDTAALLIAGEVPVPAAAEGAAADRAPIEEGPPALTIGYLLLDRKKQPVVRGPVPPVEAPPGPAGSGPSRIVFSGAVDGLQPDTYTLRVAATDSRGRVGLVEREIVLNATGTGGASAGDVLIGRIEPDRSVTLVPGVLDAADTIFVQWEAAVEGASTGRFRITPAGGGATLLTVPAEIEPQSEPTRGGRVRATAVVRQGLLPIGDLEIVGELTRDATVIVDRRRAFAVRGSAGSAGGATTSAAALGALVGDISGLVPRFTRDDVLASPLLGRALDVLSSRARSEAARQAIARARAGQHTAPEASLATSLANGDAATAAFLTGLADLAALPGPGPAADPSARALARADLERAAQRFRDALRADADFLPAAVFLGACYALGGRDQEAAGAWQTALIGIDDDPRLFALIVDARLRAGDAAGAEGIAAEAEKRWPADAVLRQRRPVLELAGGRVAEALTALDALEQPSADLLFAALRILHGARAAGLTVEDPTRDRARFERYATRYRDVDGPDQALVRGWAEAWK